MAKTQIKRKIQRNTQIKRKKYNKSKKQYGGGVNDLTQPIPILSISEVTQMGFNTINRLQDYLKNNLQSNLKNSINILINTIHVLLQTLNNTLSDPKIRNDFKIAIQKLSIFSTIFLTAMEGPLLKSMDVLRNSAVKFAQGLSSGVIQVLVSVGGAIPFWGAILDMGRAINNSTEILVKATEAGRTTIGAVQSMVEGTKQNIDRLTNNLDLGQHLDLSKALNNKIAKSTDAISQRIQMTEATSGGGY